MITRHPKGLYVLFFTEMWERFGYYLMLNLFMLYLTEHLKMTNGAAGSLVGTYMAMVYLSPFFGGILADRIIGYRRAVLLGAAILSAGYFLLGLDRPSLLFYAIGLLALGNGLFKPNISTLVGNLYPQGDPRRDAAFSIFYMGVNFGSLFSPQAGSWMRTHIGWGAAFSTAGVGMLAAIVIFALFQAHVAVADTRSSVGAVLDVALPREYEDRADPPAVERERIRALVIMCLIVMIFWAGFNQNASSLVIWADKHTDLTLGGLLKTPLSPEQFGSINPFFVIVLTPPLVMLFNFLRKRGLEPSTPGKIGLGMLLTTLSFAVMVAAAACGGDHGRVSAWWLVGSYFVVTLAELCLSPMGLSMVTKLAPRRMTAMMMGVWFLATAIGSKVSGQLAVLWDSWPHHSFFAIMVVASLAAAFVLAVQLPRLRRAMPQPGKTAP